MPKCQAGSEDLEGRLLMETQEVDAKRRELEVRLRAVDTVSKLLIDKAAQSDIELALKECQRGTETKRRSS